MAETPDQNVPQPDDNEDLKPENEEDNLPPIVTPELPPSDFELFKASNPPPEDESDFFWFWLDMVW